MKKFLTVLLALSVVFTYSFGTVFAVTPTTDDKSVALGYVQSVYETAKSTIADNGEHAFTDGITTVTVSAINWEKAFEKAFDNLIEAVAGVDDVSATGALYVISAAGITVEPSYSEAQVKAAIVDYLASAATGTTYADPAAVPALVSQLVEDAADMTANAKSVDTSIYSTKDYEDLTTPVGFLWNKYSYVSGSDLTKGDDLFVAKDVAESIINGVVDGIASIADTKDMETTAAAMTAFDDMAELYDKYISLDGDTKNKGVEDADETWTYLLHGTNAKCYTTSEETSSDASNAATAASKKATVAANIAAAKATATYRNAAVNEKADLDKLYAAYEKAEYYMIDDDASYTVDTISTAESFSVVSRAAIAADAIEYAADLKSETNSDGTAKYDAKALDKKLDGVLIELYGVSKSVAGTHDTFAKVKDILDASAKVSYVTSVEKTSEKAKISDAVDEENTSYAGIEYYDLEWAKVKAAIATYDAAVDAATLGSDITDAKAALDKAVADIDKASVVLGYYASGKLNATATSEFAKLKAYAAALDAAQGDTDPLVFDIVDIKDTMKVDYTEGSLVAYYIDNNARTKDEIVALNAAVKAVLDGAKTKSALKSEAEAVVALISALPAKDAITIADKEAIANAFEAYDNLNVAVTSYVTNAKKLTDSVAAVNKVEMNAILTAVKALPATSAVKVSDKAAVKAVSDKIDAYNDTEMYDLVSDYKNTTVTALATEIRTQELDALKVAVKALPAANKAVLDDKATVEAARAAYDAYVADYSDALGTEVSTLKGYEEKIVAAEKELAELEPTAAEKVAALSLKASTKKVGKKIKVTLKGVAIDDSTAYVQLWKSKNAVKWSFSKRVAVTATSTYITKPYKGKTYVKFRVVTVNEDGTKNFSAWSNLGCRIVK